MTRKIEYQVVDSEDSGNDVRTYKFLKEAKEDYRQNKDAVELRKVVWTIPKGESFATAGEAERDETILMEKHNGVEMCQNIEHPKETHKQDKCEYCGISTCSPNFASHFCRGRT